ncbi:MAG: branched-chain amino acid ABC transporter permease [Candidatus Bathyarchaeia archaeon]
MLEQTIIFGTISGLIYALIALGFSLIYGISGMINLTHGAFFVVGAYIFSVLASFLLQYVSLDLYLVLALAIILSFAFTGIIGSFFYRLTFHQILGDEVGMLIASICGCLIFQQLIYIIMGNAPALGFNVPTIIRGVTSIGPTTVPTGQILAAAISFLAFAILSLILAKTKIGRAMKALSQDLEAAMLMGVSIEKLYMLTTAVSAGFSSLGGILYTSTITNSVSTYMWLTSLAISFTVVLLGGLGSIKGTLLGGLIFGYAEQAVIATIPRAGVILQSFPFIVIILVLIIRPKGLFGKRIEME